MSTSRATEIRTDPVRLCPLPAHATGFPANHVGGTGHGPQRRASTYVGITPIDETPGLLSMVAHYCAPWSSEWSVAQ
jgi:hypothetical protein